MNALEAIVRTLAEVAPDYTIYAGFGSDIDDWLAENAGSTTMIFVNVLGDQAISYGEDERATEVRSSFALWIKRISRTPEEAAEAYAEYATFRDALNGIEFDGGVLQLDGGLPAVGAGYVNSQLQLYADVAI